MEFRLPPAIVPNPRFKTDRHSFNVKLPHDIITAFNELRLRSPCSANKLIGDMVRHCLNDLSNFKQE